MTRSIRVLGIAGSLRKASFNRKLLAAARRLAPASMSIVPYEDLAGLPPFDQDAADPPPPSVAEFKRLIRAHDAVLMCVPEYNHSIPGVLKNAIDWVSFPIADNAWARKPVALLGASLSPIGTARAQAHLRQVLFFVDAKTVGKPEVLLSFANTKFDGAGELGDPVSIELIGQLLRNLQAQVESLPD